MRSGRLWRRFLLVLLGVTALPALFVLLLTGAEVRNGNLQSYPQNHHQDQSIKKREDQEFEEGLGPIPLPKDNGSWSPNREEMPTWMLEVENTMVERRRHLKEACSMLSLDVPGNDSLHRPNAWEFFVNRPHHLVWCNVFKAASTSWMYNFNVLAGYSPKFLQNSKTVPLNLARRRYSRPSLQELQSALNDSIAFLIVRHPLERLLSAYRDKLEYSLPHTFHQKLGNQIILKYRTVTPKITSIGRKSNHKNPRWPTFPEFVKYLVDVHKNGESFDMHWTPITEFCTPCQVEFDVICKFETLQEDQNYLIHLARLQEIIKPQWKNPAKGRTTHEVVAGYYSQLTKAQILQIYNIFRYDFELFGYSLDGYLDMGISDEHTATTTKT